ncbi:hypothetical protein JOM56_007758 [Amanita muscaria]
MDQHASGRVVFRPRNQIVSDSEFPDEFDVEGANLHIAPLGINNFLYNAVLLFLPYFYSSRAYLVLKSAESAEEEIESKSATAASEDTIALDRWPYVKICWNEFLDSLSNEWKTLNLISALLLTAIYNVLLLGGQGSALTQCTALMSLFSALMSLILGCLYLVRFDTMRRTYKAIQWSSDAVKTSRTVVWNIYTLLALPSAWLAWSLIFFVVCLMSIIWQPIDVNIGSASGLGPLHLASKIAVSALLFTGMVHLSFALITFAGYGSRLDESWSKKLEHWHIKGASARDTSFNVGRRHGMVTNSEPIANSGFSSSMSNRAFAQLSRHQLYDNPACPEPESSDSTG